MAEGWTHLERMGSQQTDKISATLASAALGPNRLVTAMTAGEGPATGKLKVIVWEVNGDGSVDMLGTGDGGPTIRVAVTALSDRAFVTAARSAAGTLKVTVWHVDDAGQITRRESGETGQILGEFAITLTESQMSFPFGDTVFMHRVVTAVRDSSGRLKLISWSIDNAGNIGRLKSVVDDEVDEISLATYDTYPSDTSRLVTAVTTIEGVLKVISWAIADDGAFTRLGEATGGKAKDVVARSLSHRRVVTATRNFEDNLEVQTWEFDAQGLVSLHSSAPAGKISSLDVATMNAARVVTAVRDANGELKLIVWDAVDELVRLGAQGAGKVASLLVSIVALGSDWVATPVGTELTNLKVIAWREHAISFLHGEWGPSSRRVAPNIEIALSEEARRFAKLPISVRQEIDPAQADSIQAGLADIQDSTGSQSPPWAVRKKPNVSGVDPMVAVGFDFMIVSQQGRIAFLDKKGDPLPSKNGEAVNLSSFDFFSTFLRGSRADGTRNEHCINRHTDFPPSGASPEFPPGHLVHCDPDSIFNLPVPPVCMWDFFDTRVHFDPQSRRFFVLCPLRATKTVSGVVTSKPWNPLARRYWALAVSRTEDPRDGFHQWLSTEASWFDFPRMTVAEGVFVWGPAEGPRIEFGTTKVDEESVGLASRPTLYVLSVEDLVKGKPYPRSHKFFPFETHGNLVPLHQHGDSGGRIFAIRTRNTFVEAHCFRKPSDWHVFPPLEMLSFVEINVNEIGGVGISATLRDGMIHLVTHKVHEKHVADSANGRYSLRLFRIPLLSIDSKPTLTIDPAAGFIYRNFGDIGPGDAVGDIVSYERPAIAVGKEGHMVIVYGRVQFKTAKNLFPEVRYSVYYNDDRKLQSSRLLQSGGFMPMEVDNGTTLTTILTPVAFIEYATAAVDPVDDRSVWVISEYADAGTGGYRTVLGKVTP